MLAYIVVKPQRRDIYCASTDSGGSRGRVRPITAQMPSGSLCQAHQAAPGQERSIAQEHFLAVQTAARQRQAAIHFASGPQAQGEKGKRFFGRVFADGAATFGIENHRKAHDAGNDSMSVGGSKIEASASGAESGASAQPRK